MGLPGENLQAYQGLKSVAAPTVQNVFPSDSASGVVLGSTVWVVFDQEIDPVSINKAFIVEGPDTDRWTGGGLQTFDRAETPEPELFLDSPNYQGLVAGTFTFEKLDADDNAVSSGTYSAGAGAYRTKAIFSPSKNLSPSTTYTIYLAGDEDSSDTIRVGLAARTVFDVSLGMNLGSGTATVSGGYTGTIDDGYIVEITTAGDIGTAKYQWYKTSAPSLVRTGTTSTNEVELDNDVYITFGGSGFIVDDSFSFNVSAPLYMTTTYKWTFTTGSGSIISLPSTTSTTVLGGTSTSTSTTALSVSSTSPVDKSTRISVTKKRITVTFSANIDSDTITQETVSVTVNPVDGVFDGSDLSEIGAVPKVLTVSGKDLYIDI